MRTWSDGVGTRYGVLEDAVGRGVIISTMAVLADMPPDCRHWANPVNARARTLQQQQKV